VAVCDMALLLSVVLAGRVKMAAAGPLGSPRL
jgi:hypothetical protein